jgi:hypothetical protein
MGSQIQGIREYSVGKNICTQEGRSNIGCRKLHNEELHNLYYSDKLQMLLIEVQNRLEKISKYEPMTVYIRN